MQKLAKLLWSINDKKSQMKRLQKEVEIKISELDKLLDDIQKDYTPDNSGADKNNQSQIHKTQQK